MNQSLLHTLLELGHNTSQNLGFVYDYPGTSYGEETITETNLIEIRRRHPQSVKVLTFSKQKESRSTGADWEWHIIGSKYTLKLRVQAKRVTKFGKVPKLNHQAKTAPMAQIDLLIKSAKMNNMKPIYCFYCAEKHRTIWNNASMLIGAMETGCLIVDAQVVKAKKVLPKDLSEIELDTVPWHYLCTPGAFLASVAPIKSKPHESVTQHYLQTISLIEPGDLPDVPERELSSRFPTVWDLNKEGERDFDREGVEETEAGAFERTISDEEFFERSVSRIVLQDVREPDQFALKFDIDR
jgi:hypothetical protein